MIRQPPRSTRCDPSILNLDQIRTSGSDREEDGSNGPLLLVKWCSEPLMPCASPACKNPIKRPFTYTYGPPHPVHITPFLTPTPLSTSSTLIFPFPPIP